MNNNSDNQQKKNYAKLRSGKTTVSKNQNVVTSKPSPLAQEVHSETETNTCSVPKENATKKQHVKKRFSKKQSRAAATTTTTAANQHSADEWKPSTLTPSPSTDDDVSVPPAAASNSLRVEKITKEHWATYNKELKDEFIAKPSKRTRNIKKFWEKDGDTWIEIKVFTGRIKRGSKEPVYRSLFYSVKLQVAYWDEPPTGATNIVWMQKKKENRSASTPTAKSAPIGSIDEV